MPDLPTITVTAAQASRVNAVFGSADAYRQWLRGSLRAHVLAVESSRLDAQHETEKRAALDTLNAELP